jgi:hypothetical protein
MYPSSTGNSQINIYICIISKKKPWSNKITLKDGNAVSMENRIERKKLFVGIFKACVAYKHVFKMMP